MFLKFAFNCIAFACVSLLVVSAGFAEEPDSDHGDPAAQVHDWLSITLEQSQAADKIEQTLSDATTLEFIETPLADVAAYLGELHDINVQLDTRALEATGIASDTPISRDLRNISLRSALRITLADLELTYVIADEVLLITTPEKAHDRAEIRVYKVDGLLTGDDDANELAVAISDMLKDSSASTGGPVARDIHASRESSPRQITAYGKLLIVRDTTMGHRKITNLLKAMQRGIDATRPTETEPTIIPIPSGPAIKDRSDPAGDRSEDPNDRTDS